MWINRDSPPVGKDFEDCWDLVIKGDSDEVARLARLDPSDSEVMEITASDEERIKQQGQLSVVIDNSSASQDKPSEQLSGVHSTELTYRPNPASKGKHLSELLDGKPGKKPAKPTSRKRKSKANDQGPPITQSFKVAKPAKSRAANDKYDDSLKPMVMVEIPSSSYRSNGPILPKPNDVHTPAMSAASPPWEDPAIISPKGKLPNGMEKLLNMTTENA
jgi:NAD-dependent histone deacetylase SIR2